MVAPLVLGGGAVELLLGVEDLEGEDGEAVDDEAGRLGVERRGGMDGSELEEGGIDLLGEVVAELVEAVDLVLDVGDGGVGGAGVAGFVFAVPEVEVGAVLVEDDLVEGGGGDGGGCGGVVTVEGGLVVQGDDAVGVEHGCVW